MAFSLRSTLRAAIVGVTLAGASLSAMPAQAQPSGSFSFSFGSGGAGFHFGNRPSHRHCMTDPQVRRELRRHGYRDIRFFDRRGRVVQVYAEKGRRDFRIAVDTCRGRIVDIDRIRRR